MNNDNNRRHDWPSNWDAPTERFHVNSEAEIPEAEFSAQEVWTPPEPDPADVFLRRAFMSGAAMLVWLIVLFGAIFCVLELFGPQPVQDVYPPTAPSLLACSPGEKDC